MGMDLVPKNPTGQVSDWSADSPRVVTNAGPKILRGQERGDQDRFTTGVRISKEKWEQAKMINMKSQNTDRLQLVATNVKIDNVA